MTIDLERWTHYLLWPAAPVIDTAHGPLTAFLLTLAIIAGLLWKTAARADRLSLAAAAVGAAVAGALALHLETNDLLFSAHGYPPPFHNAVALSCAAIAIAAVWAALRPRHVHTILAGALALWFAGLLLFPWERAMSFPRREFAADLALLERGMTRSDVAAIMKGHGPDKEFDFQQALPNISVTAPAVAKGPLSEPARISWAPSIPSPFVHNTAVASFDDDGRINGLWYAGKPLWPGKAFESASIDPNSANQDPL